jgi:hypothetical protein
MLHPLPHLLLNVGPAVAVLAARMHSPSPARRSWWPVWRWLDWGEPCAAGYAAWPGPCGFTGGVIAVAALTLIVTVWHYSDLSEIMHAIVGCMPAA